MHLNATKEIEPCYNHVTPALYNMDCTVQYIKKHPRYGDETRGRICLKESSWIIASSQTELNKLATASKVTRLFLNPTHIFSLGRGLCGFHGKFMWDTRISWWPQMSFSCVSFCRNILALWSVPLPKPGRASPRNRTRPYWTSVAFRFCVKMTQWVGNPSAPSVMQTLENDISFIKGLAPLKGSHCAPQREFQLHDAAWGS